MEDRKARIAALRAKAGRNKSAEAAAGAPNRDPTTSRINEKRNNEPVLQAVTLTNSSSEPPLRKKQKGSEQKKESVLVKALRQAQAEAKNSALISGGGGGALEDMAPKKINADLKREIQPKLDKLERRTQKAIVALLRERLEREAAAEIDD